ncbi:MopE-related protein, partial [Nanoarchaeota archaeon]
MLKKKRFVGFLVFLSVFSLIATTITIAQTECEMIFTITGEKFNLAKLYLKEDYEVVEETVIERIPGNPNEQGKTINYPVNLETHTYTLDIGVDCEDQNGANPLFLEVSEEKDKLATLRCNKNDPEIIIEDIDIEDILGYCPEQESCIPEPEVCNAKDDDCNNQIDENISEQCGETNLGECSRGIRTCDNGLFGDCIGVVEPEEEICDGLDNNCNGLIDENLVQTCGSNEGICRQGTQTCSNGNWSDCAGTFQPPEEETCNSVDDNCDGTIDEDDVCFCTDGETRICGSDVGECQAGVQSCINNDWAECSGEILPENETCDGLDNDCDGIMDEDLTQTYGETDIGRCEFGIKTCLDVDWVITKTAVTPVDETCNDIDDDCDGLADESLSRQCGDTDAGECNYGYETCTVGIWGNCENAVLPEDETCDDGLDNDCDWLIDEECGETNPLKPIVECIEEGENSTYT